MPFPPFGSQASLRAVPASGYVFQKWSDGATEQTRSVTMDGNKTLTALFLVDE